MSAVNPDNPDIPVPDNPDIPVPDNPDIPSPDKGVEVDPGNNPDEVNFDPTKETGSEEKS